MPSLAGSLGVNLDIDKEYHLNSLHGVKFDMDKLVVLR